MKKVFKIFNCFLICFFAITILMGCSCSRPVNLYYNVSIELDNESGYTPKIQIETKIFEKFREPADTPCYKKVEAGYDKIIGEQVRDCYEGKCYKKDGKKYNLLEDSEIYKCTNGELDCYTKVELEPVYTLIEEDLAEFCEANNCYKKDGTEYVAIDKNTELNLCQEGSLDCYKQEKINHKYVLIDSKAAEGISSCYTEDGKYFEKAVAGNVSQTELSNKVVLDTVNKSEKTSYESEKIEMPKEEKYSLIYEFVIRSLEESDVYIKTMNVETIFGIQLKNENVKEKILISCENASTEFIDGEEYYKLEKGKNIKLIIQIKPINTKDMIENNKNLKMNLNLVIIK